MPLVISQIPKLWLWQLVVCVLLFVTDLRLLCGRRVWAAQSGPGQMNSYSQDMQYETPKPPGAPAQVSICRGVPQESLGRGLPGHMYCAAVPWLGCASANEGAWGPPICMCSIGLGTWSPGSSRGLTLQPKGWCLGCPRYLGTPDPFHQATFVYSLRNQQNTTP